MATTFEAHFSDGRTAARRKVSVSLGNGILVIEPQPRDDGNRTLTWAFGDLRLADEIRSGKPVRLINTAQSAARLTFVDDGILEALLASAPHLRDPGVLGRRPGLRLAQWAAGVAAVIAILFYGLPRAAEPVAAMMPLAWEEALGKQVLGGIQEKYGLCKDLDGAIALFHLMVRLSGVIDSRYKFRISVANTDAVNAFAAPGGYLVLNKGLIEAAQSPDEVAGVVAHEMGHVLERHATEGIVRATGLVLIVQLLLGDPSGVLGAGVAAGELLLSLAYSREAEAESDAVAVDILAAAGIDSAGFAEFLERLSKKRGKDRGNDETARQGSAPPETAPPETAPPETTPEETVQVDEIDIPFLSTHPRSAQRAAVVRATGSPGGPAMSEADWQKLRRICG